MNMEYCLVIHPNLNNLIYLIDEKLKEGWKVEGGITIDSTMSTMWNNKFYSTLYMQTLILGE